MNVYDLLMPISILGTLAIGTILFTKTLTDYFLRKKMVEKGYVNEENKMLLDNFRQTNKLNSLKWGLLVFSSGFGLVIIDTVALKENSTLPFGIFAICLSIGFLSYFILARKLSDKEGE